MCIIFAVDKYYNTHILPFNFSGKPGSAWCLFNFLHSFVPKENSGTTGTGF